MKTFSSFFEKFKHLKNPKEERERIAVIVSKELGIEFTGDQISLSKSIISIKTDSYTKTEIFIKKDKILESLKANNFRITDIR